MSDRQPRGGGRRRRRRFRDRQRPEGGARGQGGRHGASPQGGSAEPRKGGGPRGELARSAGRGNQRPSGERQGGGRDRRGGRRDRGRGGREREQRLEYTSVITLPEDQSTLCPICGKLVRDAVSALCYGEDRAPAHFDCVIERLRSQNALAEDERLCYLGGGHFGVVKSPQGEGKVPFSIRDRVQYEAGQERPDWRRVLDAIAARKKQVPPATEGAVEGSTEPPPGQS